MSSSDTDGKGFFGAGAWGRRIFWGNIPAQHQALDTEGYLESLLKTWGDEAEALLQKMFELPFQREPYEVRGHDDEAEWFYITDVYRYEDDDLGAVFRLVGEKDFTSMPNTDESDVPTVSEEDIAEWFDWWPYKPISEIAGTWMASIPSFDNAGRGTETWVPGWGSVKCDVVRVRTRSYDQPEIYNEDTSQGNEVWVKAGDLNVSFDYLSDNISWRDNWSRIGIGTGTAQPEISLPYVPARIKSNTTDQTAISKISSISQSNPCLVTFDSDHGKTTGDYIRIDDIVGMTELNLGTFKATVTGVSTLTLDGIDASAYTEYISGGNGYQPWSPSSSQLRLKMELTSAGVTGVYDVPDKYVAKIVSATNAKPCVISTEKEHNYSTGDIVSFKNVRGMTQLNGAEFEVYVESETSFKLKDSNSLVYDVYTGGGEVTYTGSLNDESGNLYPELVLDSSSGTSISITVSGSVVTISDTSAPYTESMVGNTITINGFIEDANNGIFKVTRFVSSTQIEYTNENAEDEAGSISAGWSVGTGVLDTTTSYGTVVYQTGEIAIDLSLISDTVMSGSDVSAKWYARGYYIPFYPQPVINHFSKDFGFLNDENDPEDVQRSTIANLTKYFGLKASADSYRIRGEISLFTVEAKALFSLGISNEPLWSTLPTENAFEYGGKLYTDISPRRVRYDDIRGDEQFFDPDVWSWRTLIDNDLMYTDGSKDGNSTGLAFGLDVTQGSYAPVREYPHASTGISSVVSVTPSVIKISGSHVSAIVLSGKVGIFGSDNNDGMYTVVNATLNGSDTDIQVEETIPDTSPTDAGEITWIVETRDPAGIISSEELSSTEAASFGLVAGYRVSVEMMRCQYEVFNFFKGSFGLTTYIRAGSSTYPDGIAPDIDDFVYWIDDVETVWEKTISGATSDQDIGVWSVLVGIGINADGDTLGGPVVGHVAINGVDTGTNTLSIPGDYTGTVSNDNKIEVIRSTGNNGVYDVDTVFWDGTNTEITCIQTIPDGTVDGVVCLEDVAVRYYPKVAITDCSFCRTYKIRVEVEPTEEAYEYYGTEEDLASAINRIKRKIAPRKSSAVLQGTSIVPIHARVVDWAITTSNVLEDVITTTETSHETEKFMSDLLGVATMVDNSDPDGLIYLNGQRLRDIENFSSLTYCGVKHDILDVKFDLTTDMTIIQVSGNTSSEIGGVYLFPNSILMKVEQRGTMSFAQKQEMIVRNASGTTVWTDISGSGVDDNENWYTVVDNVDLTEELGNQSTVEMAALVSSGTMTNGSVRFTFEISKYEK